MYLGTLGSFGSFVNWAIFRPMRSSNSQKYSLQDISDIFGYLRSIGENLTQRRKRPKKHKTPKMSHFAPPPPGGGAKWDTRFQNSPRYGILAKWGGAKWDKKGWGGKMGQKWGGGGA